MASSTMSTLMDEALASVGSVITLAKSGHGYVSSADILSTDLPAAFVFGASLSVVPEDFGSDDTSRELTVVVWQEGPKELSDIEDMIDQAWDDLEDIKAAWSTTVTGGLNTVANIATHRVLTMAVHEPPIGEPMALVMTLAALGSESAEP